jgi:hypothetical protein
MAEEITAKKCFRIFHKKKGPLEGQERDGRTMLKIIRKKWVLDPLSTEIILTFM